MMHAAFGTYAADGTKGPLNVRYSFSKSQYDFDTIT